MADASQESRQTARLALDQSVQGQKLGGVLLADALGRIVAATATIAARLVVVDAIDANAVRFYEHHGFRAIPGTQRLIQKVSDIAAALVGTTLNQTSSKPPQSG